MNTSSTTSAVTVGIPAGVDPENVRSRKAAMVAAGTPEILAESIATTAAHQQHLRDHKLKETPVVTEKVVTAPVITKTTQKVANLKASKPPKKIAVPVATNVPVAAIGSEA